MKDRSKFYVPLFKFKDGTTGQLRDLDTESLKKWFLMWAGDDRAWQIQIDPILKTLDDSNRHAIVQAFSIGSEFAREVFEGDMQELVKYDDIEDGRGTGRNAGIDAKKEQASTNYKCIRKAVIEVVGSSKIERIRYRTDLKKEVEAKLPSIVYSTISCHVDSLVANEPELVPQRFRPRNLRT